jgi:hypothetical protein
LEVPIELGTAKVLDRIATFNELRFSNTSEGYSISVQAFDSKEFRLPRDSLYTTKPFSVKCNQAPSSMEVDPRLQSQISALARKINKKSQLPVYASSGSGGLSVTSTSEVKKLIVCLN